LGIVYHANFLCFFERARTEMLRHNGFNLTTMATYGTHFAIHEIHIRYMYPARLDDVLTITTNIEKIKPCSLVFKQKMCNQMDEHLSEATVCVVCVDSKMQPKRLERLGGMK
jgi:acyl-CoA thioester hydrolase